MSGIPRATNERPPPIFEGETNIALAPMVCGAAGVKRFFEDKNKDGRNKKMTKEQAAKELGKAVGTVKNMLTAGKLTGDGKGGVTDESVEAFKAKEKMLDTDTQEIIDEREAQSTAETAFGEKIEEAYLAGFSLSTEKPDIPAWLLNISEKIHKKGYEQGFEAGVEKAESELMAAQSVSADDILAVLGEKAAV